MPETVSGPKRLSISCNAEGICFSRSTLLPMLTNTSGMGGSRAALDEHAHIARTPDRALLVEAEPHPGNVELIQQDRGGHFEIEHHGLPDLAFPVVDADDRLDL